MRRQPDTVKFSIPTPGGFDATAERITWLDWTGRAYPFEDSPFPTEDDPEDKPEGGPDDEGPLTPREAFDFLDKFCLTSRGTPAQRVSWALALARERCWPLTLCGICGRRHVWDRVTPHPARGRSPFLDDSWSVEDPALRLSGRAKGKWLGDKGARLASAGAESADEWLAWADIINAIRRVAIANRDGRAGEPVDVAKFWPAPSPGPDDYPGVEYGPGESAAERRQRNADAWADADQQVLVARVVDRWLLATHVVPTLFFPKGAPFGVPPSRIVRVGSVLGWLGWTLREELTSESGAAYACEVCGVTFHKLRRRAARTMCELHDDARRMQESRARRREEKREMYAQVEQDEQDGRIVYSDERDDAER